MIEKEKREGGRRLPDLLPSCPPICKGGCLLGISYLNTGPQKRKKQEHIYDSPMDLLVHTQDTVCRLLLLWFSFIRKNNMGQAIFYFREAGVADRWRGASGASPFSLPPPSFSLDTPCPCPHYLDQQHAVSRGGDEVCGVGARRGGGAWVVLVLRLLSFASSHHHHAFLLTPLLPTHTHAHRPPPPPPPPAQPCKTKSDKTWTSTSPASGEFACKTKGEQERRGGRAAHWGREDFHVRWQGPATSAEA